MVKTDKILIVGGGSAGWMTAATLIKEFPNRDITLVESPSVPTIGVGEGTVPEIHSWLKFLEIDFKEFMVEASGGFKITTRFNDWAYKGSTFDIYAWFGHEERYYKRSGHIVGYKDWLLKRHFFPETTPTSDFSAFNFPQHYLVKNNGFTLEALPQLFPFDPMVHTALHVDAVKFAKYLEEKYAKPRGVKHVLGNVAKVDGNEYGVTAVVLDDGTRLEADLFVDCTGFKSLLLGEFLEEEWISNSENVGNNRAFFAPVAYTDKKKEFEPVTSSTALSAGWAWNTPIYSRIGTGYIFNNEYIDEDDALKEFKAYLDSNWMAVPNEHRSEELNIRKLSMKNGRYKKTFVKNVVGIGLSTGFIDALEATGLFFIFSSALQLLYALKNPTVTMADRDRYNDSVNSEWHLFAEFIHLHYLMTRREDTPYWANYANSSIPEKTLEKLRNSDANGSWDAAGHSWMSTVIGMEAMHFNGNNAAKFNTFSGRDANIKKHILNRIEYHAPTVDIWSEVSKSLPSQYEVLRDNFHDGNG
jgi:tryptophan halogenase